MKKSLTIGIILLFIFCNVSFTTLGDENSDNLSGKTLYVDDEGDGDYTCIQDAIDNANEGDTILVYSGNYARFWLESNNLSQPINEITLRGTPYELGEGNDTGKPVVDGHDWYCIVLRDANKCKIEGFEIINGDEGIVLSDSSNNTLANNTIKHCFNGIEFCDFTNDMNFTTDNIVEKNYIINCDIGIENECCPRNIFRNNIFENNECGILIDFASDCRISNNRFLNNGIFYTNGISGIRSFNCIIKNNYFKGLSDSIYIVGLNSCILDGNYFEDNKNCILLGLATNCIIQKNHFENNNLGVYLAITFNTKVNENNFINNSETDATFLSTLYTIWKNNYWGEVRSLPKTIYGFLFYVSFFNVIPIGPIYKNIPNKTQIPEEIRISIPWIQFDWFPAKEPYEIQVPEV